MAKSKIDYLKGKIPMSSNKSSLFVIVALIMLVVAACQPAAPATVEPATSVSETAETDANQPNYAGKKVLWVDSYHVGYEWSDGLSDGIHNVLDTSGVEIRDVHMDTKNNGSNDFCMQAGNDVKAIIDSFQPDVIIASDDNAQRCLIVPHVLNTTEPVVFTAVNWDASKYGYPTDHVTGMVEIELIDQLFDHLRRYANGERFAMVTIDTETERTIARTYNERFFDGQMAEYYATTQDEFETMFLQAQENADIVLTSNNAGTEWDDARAQAFFTANTRVPTGSVNPWMAPYVLITIGKVPEELGEWAAQTALSIIDGTPVADIPVTTNKRGTLILNLNIAEALDITFEPNMLRFAEIYGGE
jgi:hypothetical protein